MTTMQSNWNAMVHHGGTVVGRLMEYWTSRIYPLGVHVPSRKTACLGTPTAHVTCSHPRFSVGNSGKVGASVLWGRKGRQ